MVGILHTGFRIAPSDSEHTGAMFGDGIYFSDIFTKAFNYTSGQNYHQFSYGKKHVKPPKKYMFLCEVALGTSKELFESESTIKGIPGSKFQSVKGLGERGPNPADNIYLPNGCIMPLGKIEKNEQPKTKNFSYWQLNHDEYIVYDTTQVRIRYLLELR